jgi:hypothetical protein
VFDEPPVEEEADESDEAAWEPEPASPVPSRAPRGRSPYERPSFERSASERPSVERPSVERPSVERPSVERASASEPEVATLAAPAPVDRFDDEHYEDEAGHGARHDEYEDLEFPIADYDELRVAEILPLLEELEPDEIEVVRDREVAGRNRAVVLRKLEELGGGVPAPAAGRRPAAPAVNGTRQRPTVERPAVEPPADGGYEDEDAGYESAEEDFAQGGRGASHVDFPIADYDDLRLTEILPLLPQLEPVELEMVRQRELEGERRATLLNRIDALIGSGPARAPARQGR